ncbi:NADH dehydrogenase ubiquinone Fe-S protein 4 [Notoacmeibacter marinus]|uniref:NADH dehydrogenase ubiquinone Fe-S protein 4 n=1 Tax=Notoacmeibacter marinus TaxID=1876515 RepID=UPI000DF3CA70
MEGRGRQNHLEGWPEVGGVVLYGHTPTARIFKPCRSVMQAGRANTRHWVLEFTPRSAPFIEPLMGWTGSRDTLRQVRLTFPTKESAVAFAERHGLPYSVHAPPEERLQLQSYADNFRPRPWRNDHAAKPRCRPPHTANGRPPSDPDSQQQERR